MSIPICVCVVVYNTTGQIATVARRHDHEKWGLPGGSIEPEDGDVVSDLNATLRRAAVRELFEETGIEVSAEELLEVYTGVCKDQSGGDDPDSITFAFASPRPCTGLKTREGEPPARWQEWESITKEGSFHDFNRRIYDAV